MNPIKSNQIAFSSRCAVFCTATIVLFSSAATAQEWRIQPEVRVGVEYDDNSRLSTDPAFIQDIDGLLIGASVGINYATQRSTFSIRPRISSRNYDENPDVDSNDGFVDVNFNHKFLKGDFGILASFANESVRTAERSDPDIDEDDPDQIPDDETGLVFTSEDRDRIRVSPQWNYEISERTSLAINAEYLDVSYDGVVISDFVDYSDVRIKGALVKALTERTSAYVGVGARKFDNKVSNSDYDGVSAGIGMRSNISETTRIQAEIGYEDAELKSTGQSDSAVVANVSLVRNFQTVRFLMQLRRTVSPSGNGRVSERDSINFNIRKKFSERVSAGLGLRSSTTEDIVNTTQSSGERDFLQLRAQLDVAISRSFSVEANYRYTNIDRPQADGAADSNSFTLWLVYRPTAIVK